MEKFSKNIEGIRKMMKDMKAEKYAIVNPDLIDKDEYIKSLYLKVLCTVVQYENDPTDMQILFLKRIISGIGLEDTVEEYMRKALEISELDIKEFLSIVGESKAKYYFATDGLIITSMRKGNSSEYEYLAELIELLGINKDDLEYLCMVVKSVLQQESSYYDQSKLKINERVEEIDFTPYINNYYSGAIVDTDTEKHYSAPDKNMSKSIEYPILFKERKVVFENVVLNIEEDWTFEGCEEVIFRNCLILGKESSFTFSSIGRVEIDKCKVKDFSNRIAYTKSVNNLIVTNSEFIECGYTGSGDVRGGMIYASGNKFEEIRVESNKLINCYVSSDSNSYYFHDNGIMFGFEGKSYNIESFIVVNNEFIGCECRGNFCSEEAIVGKCNALEVEESNNRFTGKVTCSFEN